ncbi:hypothetical protein BTN50_0352 [Candidatus Enterovibrio altilux]|uniref:Uncharacterized protein n=1 Tax=Candidatus Enterovibrio altilux TaxID=1927128 RepID=A0A291B7A7_9GAMM|nr:hypothetical protein BTN50_0352 [Candidatus Enterovibrio luxaltus]
MNNGVINYTTNTLGKTIESMIPILQGLHDLTPDKLLLS